MGKQKKKPPAASAQTKDLLVEAHRINYRLRSTFFLRKLREYDTLGLPQQISALTQVASAFDWEARTNWSIDEDAFQFIQQSPIAPLQIFCHPKLIREHPCLMAYYRHVAVLSQKSVGYLVGLSVSRWELLPNATLTETHAMTLARLFNDHISLIVNSSARSLDPASVQGLLLASTGAQIDGSWRNAIGDEAEKVVQRLLVKEALERGVLAAFIRRTDSGQEPLYDAKRLAADFDISDYKGFFLANQTSVLFSSEPDISLLSADGSTIAVIEVKGGTDPAGALERYGAAKKSFEASLRDNAKVQTIFIASCITPEVSKRIRKDRTFTEFFNLTQLLSDRDVFQQGMQRVFGLLGW